MPKNPRQTVLNRQAQQSLIKSLRESAGHFERERPAWISQSVDRKKEKREGDTLQDLLTHLDQPQIEELYDIFIRAHQKSAEAFSEPKTRLFHHEFMKTAQDCFTEEAEVCENFALQDPKFAAALNLMKEAYIQGLSEIWMCTAKSVSQSHNP